MTIFLRGNRCRLFLTIVLFWFVSCAQPPAGRGAGEIEAAASGAVQFRIETAATGLEVPWSIVFTPDNRILFTERPGRVRVIEGGKLRAEPVATLADVEHSGEIGLMGLTLHPQFAANHLLYLSYGYRAGGTRVRVVRFREKENALSDRGLILENVPAASLHAGCRLRFGTDGKLYITTGDAAQRELAQRLDSLAGKILRLNDDGAIPADNPFVNKPGARPEIWSYGHRNSQGIDWQPGTNLLFDTEHGPSGFDGPGGGDEVNVVERGGNYGWPLIHHRQSRTGMESPLLEYTPAVAPASGVFYRGSSFPELRGNFFFGCLRGQCIIRVVLEGKHVLSQERLVEGKYGRIRDVTQGPDGTIYFSTSNRDGRGSPASDDDRILRMTPVK
ncbi:MAG TPA: PQQ-dependent sugar dehydrogenase [Acidobacteriota bacterium]|jgi:glucose/arabinose dehydrogenase|nr:PQQ-dependent sugar dehydrogenase [Acidobacteriota bacterium]